MVSFKLTKQNIAAAAFPDNNFKIEKWCVDFPADEQSVTAETLTNGELLLQGWFACCDAAALSETRVLIKQGESKQYYQLNHPRADVIEALGLDETLVQCGFKRPVAINNADFSVGISIADQDIILVNYRVEGSFAVLRGQGDWLFLDNDTNDSVSQHTGASLMGPQQREEWTSYFVSLQQFGTANNLPFVLVIAPSKEAIYAEQHPLPRSPYTIAEQLLDLCPPEFPLIYPESLLRKASERTFRVKDTHWTHHGAMLTAIEVCAKLGISFEQMTKFFSKDKYEERLVNGDLGNKLFPVKKYKENLLRGFHYKKRLVYDNLLENFGRTLLLSNSDALSSGHCLIFGSSSSYSMLNYLVRVFSTVTMVHSAGNVDQGLVMRLNPDYLIAQTNGRFIVVPPTAKYSAAVVIKQKIAALNKDKLTTLKLKVAEQVDIIEQSGDEKLIRITHVLHCLMD